MSTLTACKEMQKPWQPIDYPTSSTWKARRSHIIQRVPRPLLPFTRQFALFRMENVRGRWLEVQMPYWILVILWVGRKGEWLYVKVEGKWNDMNISRDHRWIVLIHSSIIVKQPNNQITSYLNVTNIKIH